MLAKHKTALRFCKKCCASLRTNKKYTSEIIIQAKCALYVVKILTHWLSFANTIVPFSLSLFLAKSQQDESWKQGQEVSKYWTKSLTSLQSHFRRPFPLLTRGIIVGQRNFHHILSVFFFSLQFTFFMKFISQCYILYDTVTSRNKQRNRVRWNVFDPQTSRAKYRMKVVHWYYCTFGA